MKIFLILVMLFVIFGVLVIKAPEPRNAIWEVESIDTMKYSRDLAREKLHDGSFDRVINKQVSDIAKTGATHVAIGTPYDDEFRPILRRWVKAARANKLNVWFRGNWSGWEGWFEYPSIDRQVHIDETKLFILENKELFEDGDIFSSCPECENGGEKINIHNPQEVAEYRAFLIAEYKTAKETFQAIGKNVPANYYSMNGDMAYAIMDPETTAALDGLVVVDHYVATPEKLVADIKILAEKSGGKIVLGEFGAPIPDINGAMTDEQQKEWLEKAFKLLAETPELHGLNYWVNMDGSTAIWRTDGSARPAVAVVKKYFTAMHE